MFHRIAIQSKRTALPTQERAPVDPVVNFSPSQWREHPAALCLGKGFPSDDIGDGPDKPPQGSRRPVQSSINKYFLPSIVTAPPPTNITQWALLNQPHYLPATGDTHFAAFTTDCAIHIDSLTLREVQRRTSELSDLQLATFNEVATIF